MYSTYDVSVMMSVEFIIESFVSVYENRNIKRRPITDGRVHREMRVASNGLEFAHCNSLVKASMANYWENVKRQDGWHLARRSEDIKSLFFQNLLKNSQSNA